MRLLLQRYQDVPGIVALGQPREGVMEAQLEWNLQKIEAEIAELTELMPRTTVDPHDPDLRFARDLFAYRLQCLEKRLTQMKRIQGV